MDKLNYMNRLIYSIHTNRIKLDGQVKKKETIVNKLILDLSVEEMEKVKTTTGMVVKIIKLMEKVHSKKNLSYEDSKQLAGLVIDVLVITMKSRDISPQLNNLIFHLEQNKATVEILISETIDVWHVVSDLCQNCMGCCKKKEPRIRKSIVEKPHLETVPSSPLASHGNMREEYGIVKYTYI